MSEVPQAGQSGESLCSDCPPVGYPTDSTRCEPCPRRVQRAASVKHQPYEVLERIAYRMFEHGKTNNTVSAQCEMQHLRTLMGWTGPGACYAPGEQP